MSYTLYSEGIFLNAAIEDPSISMVFLIDKFEIKLTH